MMKQHFMVIFELSQELLVHISNTLHYITLHTFPLDMSILSPDFV